MKLCIINKISCIFWLNYRLTTIFLLLLFLPGICIKATEIHNRDENHRGLLHKNGFSYFPENRLGNGLYREGKLLVSKTGNLIFDAIEIRNTNSVVFLYSDPNKNLHLGLVNGEGDGNGRFKQIDAEFYEYTNNDIGYQRIFRLLKGKIVPVLENLRTGTGVTLSKTHAVFYHIAESGTTIIKTESGDETKAWIFKFRLHLTKRGHNSVITFYGLPIEDQMPTINLFWKDENILVVQKSNGKQLLFNLRNLAPQMF